MQNIRNNSNEVEFNRGPTWIIAMPISYEVEY